MRLLAGALGAMKRSACMLVMIAAGCQSNPPNLVMPLPVDADVDGPVDSRIDAGIDAPIDGPPSTLAQICGAEPVTLDDWENCYLKRWCEWVVNCRTMNKYRDVQECIAQSNAFEGGRLAAERLERSRAVAAQRASLNVAAFTQCLQETSEARCNTAQSSVACATRFSGTIGDDGPCYTDIECTSPGATCQSTCTGACCLGTCHPKFKLGATCDTFTSCEPGLRCDGVCFSGDINTSCGDDGDCDPNAWCNAGVCAADFAPGAACTNPLQCGGETSCIGLSITTSAPGHCLRISHAGDRCDYFCLGNLYCDGQGVCRDMRTLNQTCSGSAPCGGVDTICLNGVCVLRSNVGASCPSSAGCLPALFCTSELNDPAPVCTARRADGQPCAAPNHCESYICSGNTTTPGVCLPGNETCSANGL